MNPNRVRNVPNRVPIRNALVSTADKRGLKELVDALWQRSPELTLYSTGGTFQTCLGAARTAGKVDRVREISTYTGQPEMDGGLVKSLDWKIYLGLLSEPFNQSHGADLERQGAVAFDLVVCNFYPFETTVNASGTTVENARAFIDIGGPGMVRAAAKNFLRVAVLTSPERYGSFLASLDGDATDLDTRFDLARIAFSTVVDYDRAISKYLEGVAFDDLAVYQRVGSVP